MTLETKTERALSFDVAVDLAATSIQSPRDAIQLLLLLRSCHRQDVPPSTAPGVESLKLSENHHTNRILLRLLRSEQCCVYATEALKGKDQDWILAKVINTTRHSSLPVRKCAVNVLSESRSPSAVDCLHEILTDPTRQDLWSRSAAALEKMGAIRENTVQVLWDAIAYKAAKTEVPYPNTISALAVLDPSITYKVIMGKAWREVGVESIPSDELNYEVLKRAYDSKESRETLIAKMASTYSKTPDLDHADRFARAILNTDKPHLIFEGCKIAEENSKSEFSRVLLLTSLTTYNIVRIEK